MPDPAVRTDAGLAEIKRKSAGAYTPDGAGNMHPVGLTRTRLVSELSFRHVVLKTRNGACGRVDTVRAQLTLSPFTVYVAREVPRGTCAWREVYEHEMKHVRIERRTLRHLRPQINAYLSDAAESLGAVRGRSQDDIKRRLRAYLQSAIDQISDEIARHKNAGHAELDTLQEYRRLSRACGGEIGRILRRAGVSR